MNEKNILGLAYQNYQKGDYVGEAREKLLEYKEVSLGDYSLFFNNTENYPLKYILFAIDLLLDLKLNEFMPKPISVSLYYNFCGHIDDYNYIKLFEFKDCYLQKLIKEVFETYPDLYNNDGSLNISNVIIRDREFIFQNRAKVLFFEYLIKRYGEVLETKDEKDISLDSIKTYNHFVKFILKMNSNLVEITQKREREKILANLSHRLKNLMCGIRGELSWLDDDENKVIVNRAKENINLVCRIIDGFNYSGTGDVKDFYYDAENSSSSDDIETIILTAFRGAISNVFSSTINHNIRDNYFPTNTSFNNANDKFKLLDLTIDNINKYCQEYFFYCDIEINGFLNLKIGETKGSDVRFYMLFEELFLNAIKYISYISHEERELKIEFIYSTKGLNLIITNNYNSKRMEKGTGFGAYIVSSIVDSMNGNYNVIKGKGIYKTNICIPNFWNTKKELIKYEINTPTPISKIGEKQENYK